jgi:tetratricopeptide (TPR) repeat protein
MLLKWFAGGRKAARAGAALLDEAQALRARGELEAAGEACRQVLRDTPGEARAMAMLAAIAADQGRFDSGMQWARQALGIAPDCIPAHFAVGRLHEGAQRHADAEASYRKVVALDPAHAKAHTNVGCMLHIQGRLDEAVSWYRKALELEPGQPEALRNYALIAGSSAQLGEALAGFERHLAGHPGDANAHYQLAHLYVHHASYPQAEAAYRRAIALEPDNAEFHFSLSQLLLVLGRYAEGWREYEWRWRIERFNGSMRRFAEPLWDGRALPIGTLLVHGEAGFGDMFQFVRYARLAAQRCERVIVECQPAVMQLIEGVPGVSQVVAQGAALPGFDAHIPLISFPGVFGSTLDDLAWAGPYIHADAARQQQWAERVAASKPRRRKVGLVWSGDTTNSYNRDRAIALQSLAPLAQIDNVTFFSLQKGGPPVQPGDIPQGMHWVDLTGSLRDFSDTAALLTQLDLLISVDTGVAHLAGAMGRPAWVLLPFSPPWRYHVERADNPWYPGGMRLFRQHAQSDWSMAVHELSKALSDWANT